MTDVLAILEEESRHMRRRDRWIKGFCLFVAALTLLTTITAYLRERSVGEAIGRLVPLFVLGGVAAGYSPRHRKALQEAIHDPDPALDVHFARALAAEETSVASLGRKTFVERFADRVPELDEATWAGVARALPAASTGEAEAMLALLQAAGRGKAIGPTEAFASTTKAERLRTAARQALGDMRLRTARAIVETKVRTAEAGVESERLRLRR